MYRYSYYSHRVIQENCYHLWTIYGFMDLGQTLKASFNSPGGYFYFCIPTKFSHKPLNDWEKAFLALARCECKNANMCVCFRMLLSDCLPMRWLLFFLLEMLNVSNKSKKRNSINFSLTSVFKSNQRHSHPSMKTKWNAENYTQFQKYIHSANGSVTLDF